MQTSLWVVAVVLLGSIAGAAAWLGRGGQEVEEVSGNFDSADVRPFLERVQALVDSGFGSEQIEQISSLIQGLEPDKEAERRFRVEFGGKKVPLRVVVFMDDVDAVDLYFFTTPAFATAIESELDRFFEDRGM